MLRRANLVPALILLLAAPCLGADGLAVPRTRPTTNLPVTHVLRREYQVPSKDPHRSATGVETKYKDQSGQTVSVANTVGNLTTHKDPDGRVIGYTIAANGKSLHFDAHGRPLKTANQ